MQKVTAILLSLLMLSISGVYVAAFVISKNRIQKEIKLKIKQGVPEHELKTFSFTNAQVNALHFLKPNEFSYKGNLYDIVYREYKDGIHHFKCVDDKQETQLFAQLNQMVNLAVAQHSNSKNLSKNATITFELKYVPSTVSSLGTTSKHEITNQFAYRVQALSGYANQIDKPPIV